MTETRRHAAAAACAAALLALTAAAPAGAVPTPNTTERVTHDASGAQLSQGGDALRVSDDGCLTLIAEFNDAIATGDDNDAMDAFVRDCETGSVEHVSVDPDGDVLSGGVSSASMSADGRYVAFVAPAEPWMASGRLFVRDRATDTTRLAPVPSWAGGGPWPYDLVAVIDPSGRYVAATWAGRVFRLDLQENTATYISVDGSVELNTLSTPVSSDGDIAFTTAYGLVPEDTDAYMDAYVHDRSTGTLELASQRPSGEEATYAWQPSISANGRYVTFPATFSGEEGLGVWLMDRQEDTLVRADRAHDGSAAEGMAQIAGTVSDTCDVAYESLAENILATDTNPGQGGADAYVWDCETDETIVVSVGSGGAQGNGFTTSPVISPNGRHVTFISEAGDLAPGDTNGAWDGFVRHLAVDGG